jgi:hypothetical protein
MDLKKSTIISIIIGFILFGIGIDWYFRFYSGLMNDFDYIYVFSILFGMIIIFVSFNNIWIFVYDRYKKVFRFVEIVGFVLLISFLSLNWLNKFSLDIMILYMIVYFELIGFIFWLFIINYAVNNVNTIKNWGNIFEFLFFFFLFLSTVFLTLAVGKMSVLKWSIYDVEIIINIFLLNICYISAICSGFLHYIKKIG